MKEEYSSGKRDSVLIYYAKMDLSLYMPISFNIGFINRLSTFHFQECDLVVALPPQGIQHPDEFEAKLQEIQGETARNSRRNCDHSRRNCDNSKQNCAILSLWRWR